MKLIKLEETITDYICPECGSLMSSGILEPGGGYDDWLILPHCTECPYQPESWKFPFLDLKTKEDK